MSLINNMLSDLKERHGNINDENKVLFEGLAPVTDTGFANSRIPYTFLFASFSIVALSIASVGYFGNYNERSGIQIDLPIEKVPSALTLKGQEIQTPDFATS